MEDLPVVLTMKAKSAIAPCSSFKPEAFGILGVQGTMLLLGSLYRKGRVGFDHLASVRLWF